MFESAGNMADAEQALAQALLTTGQAPAVLESMAQFLVRRDRDRDAAAIYRQWLAGEPDSAPALLGLGLILADYPAFAKEAMTRLREALQHDPTLRHGYRPLAKLLLAAGRRDEAISCLQAWLEATPDDPVATHLLAAFKGGSAPARASDAFVRQTFDGHAHHFDHLLRDGLEYRAPELLMERIGPRLPGVRSPVLDLGCGTGLCAPLLRPHASRLVGIDLSKPMLEQARARRLYDELVAAELTAYLQTSAETFGLVVATDTFVYLGALDSVFHNTFRLLHPGGWLAFTVEHPGEDHPVAGGHELTPTGRYRHQSAYIDAALQAAGFAERDLHETSVRKEAGVAVRSLIVTARKPLL